MGIVRLIDPEKGTIVKEFAPVAVKTTSVAQNAPVTTVSPKQEEAVETETLPKGLGARVARGSAQRDPADQQIRLRSTCWSRASSPRVRRSTRPGWSSPSFRRTSPLVSRSGLVRPKVDGKATLSLSVAGKTVDVPVTVLGPGDSGTR